MFNALLATLVDKVRSGAWKIRAVADQLVVGLEMDQKVDEGLSTCIEGPGGGRRWLSGSLESPGGLWR